jgi:hypothetical protein
MLTSAASAASAAALDPSTSLPELSVSASTSAAHRTPNAAACARRCCVRRAAAASACRARDPWLDSSRCACATVRAGTSDGDSIRARNEAADNNKKMKLDAWATEQN